MSKETKESSRSREETSSGASTRHDPGSFNSETQLVVGIGASAGGLESIEQFFENIDSNTGAAFVVIQHLSPDFKSFLPQIMGQKTVLPVLTATDKLLIRPNHIYCIPPGVNLVVRDRALRLVPIDQGGIPNKPIDLFLESLAQDVGDRAVAVILSGTGTDGAEGIRHISAAGGRVYVESPGSAKFNSMPLAALARRVHERVGAPFKLATTLFGRDSGDLHSSATHYPIESDGSEERVRIFDAIERRYGVDFSSYKIAMVNRRIDRRITELDLSSVPEYWAFFQKNEAELSTLYDEMLIGVTRFFRDSKAFELLTNEVKRIVAKKSQNEEIRVWSAGCASGEETYSLAMLFSDEMERCGKSLTLKVFATDVDDENLSRASTGLYRNDQMSQVPSALLARYFELDGDRYKANLDLRSCVIFARHNVMTDAPFNNLDMVVCRNLLIYLAKHAQQTVLSMFTSSLMPLGTLFLGPNESLGTIEVGYSVIDRRWNIYRKLDPSATTVSRTGFSTQRSDALQDPIDGLQSHSDVPDETPSSQISWSDMGDVLALKRENRMFLLATQGSEIGIWDWDFQSGEQVWSKKFHELLGYPEELAHGLSFDRPSIVHPEDKVALTDLFRQHFVDCVDFDIEVRLQTFDNNYRWYRLQGKATRSSTGKVRRMVGSAQDVHKTRIAQQELEAQAEIHRFVTHETNDGWWDWHLQTDYQYMSPRFWRTFGYDPSTKAHNLQEWRSLIHPDDLRESIVELATHSKTRGGQPFSQEMRYKHSEGHWVTVLCRARVIEWDNKGKPVRMVGVHTDISKLKAQEAQLKKFNAQLAKSNEDLEQFAYITSHDLKAPLRGIATLVDFLEEDLRSLLDFDSDDSQRIRKNLRRLARQATRMESLISGVLDYSRVDSIGATVEEIDVRELLLDIAIDHSLEVGSGLVLPEFLPTLSTDPIMFEQVLGNLISNAVKFHPTKEELIISIECVADGEAYEFSVIDNGPGISPEFHQRIFDMFYTMQCKDSSESTGIGLTLVKRIVEKFGGRIEVDSEEGKGAVFRFTWPAGRQKPLPNT